MIVNKDETHKLVIISMSFEEYQSFCALNELAKQKLLKVNDEW